MKKVTAEILPGFTPGDKILWYTWEGFGWFGKLQVELDGEFYVINACGVAHGDNGDMTFKIFENITQEQADKLHVIAHQTDNPRINETV